MDAFYALNRSFLVIQILILFVIITSMSQSSLVLLNFTPFNGILIHHYELKSSAVKVILFFSVVKIQQKTLSRMQTTFGFTTLWKDQCINIMALSSASIMSTRRWLYHE